MSEKVLERKFLTINYSRFLGELKKIAFFKIISREDTTTTMETVL